MSAAQAVSEAIRRRYGDRVAVSVVDALKDYAPFPLNYVPEFYAHWVRRSGRTWKWSHDLTDGRRRAHMIMKMVQPWMGPRMRALVLDEPVDLLLCVHTLENHLLPWALKRLGLDIPFLTLVTDPVTAHATWLCSDVDLCMVGSEQARRKALEHRIHPSKVTVTGLPVNPRFIDNLRERADARAMLGWSPYRRAVLLVGGGDGVGNLRDHARAIDAECRGITIAVVTGRNERLLRRLRADAWRNEVHLYGFVDHATEMSVLMSAADALVTKAGPGTIHDAFLAGLPILLSGAIPGQEYGNIELVLNAGAGVWAPQPELAASLIGSWFRGKGDTLERLSEASRALARADAADAVAREVWGVLTGLRGSTEPELLDDRL